MNLDGILRHAFFDEEVGYLDTLITLELDDLTGLLILNERAVASEFLTRGWCQPPHKHRIQYGPPRTFLNAFRSFLASYSAQHASEKKINI